MKIRMLRLYDEVILLVVVLLYRKVFQTFFATKAVYTTVKGSRYIKVNRNKE